MNSDRMDALVSAMGLTYDDDDRMADGRPHVSALNRNLPDGVDHAHADERDEAWAVYSAGTAASTEEPPHNSDGGTREDGPVTPVDPDDRPEQFLQAGEALNTEGGSGSDTAPQNTEANPPEGPYPNQQGEVVDVTEMEDAPEGDVRITLTASPMNPHTVYVNGRQLCSLRVGETATVPAEALEALSTSGATYEIKD